jgi:hypothetical protein
MISVDSAPIGAAAELVSRVAVNGPRKQDALAKSTLGRSYSSQWASNR